MKGTIMFKTLRKIFELNATYFVERPFTFLFEAGVYWIAMHTITKFSFRKINEKFSNKMNARHS